MNGILLCAGTGKRFQPLSFTTPKPLTPVNGLPLIEHTLSLLRRGGVKRITVVTGYLPESFSYLERKYGVETVFNSHFADTNNNTSLAAVSERLDGSLIIDGDLFFNADFLPFVQAGKSQFISQRTEYGEEWELMHDKAGRVLEVKKWSPSGFGMVGVSYWQGEGAALLAEELRNCSGEEYWEDAAIRVLKRTPVYLTKVEPAFLREMDSLVDALNQGILSHANIADLLSPGFAPKPLKGLTNFTWLIKDHDKTLRSLRIPGRGTEKFIARAEEPVIIDLIKDLVVTPETRFYAKGLKTCAFLSKHRITSFKDLNSKYFARLAATLAKLHAIKHREGSLRPMYVRDEIAKYEGQARARREALAADDPNGIKSSVMSLTVATAGGGYRDWLLEKAALFDSEQQVLSHRDLLLENIMILNRRGEGLQLIDFEYAGFCNALWDPASFILEANITGKARMSFVRACGLDSPADELRLRQLEVLVDYIWGLWGVVNKYDDYAQMRLRRSIEKYLYIKNS